MFNKYVKLQFVDTKMTDLHAKVQVFGSSVYVSYICRYIFPILFQIAKVFILNTILDSAYIDSIIDEYESGHICFK